MRTKLNNHLPISGNSSVTVIVVLAASLLLAVILGVQLGSGDYYAASLWLVVGIAAVYLTHLHHYTWQIVMLAVFLGFSYQPTGFAITSRHVGLLLGACLAMLYILSPISFRPTNHIRNSGIGGLKVALIIWIAYGAIHGMWNHIDPFLPSQYALKNALKSYVEAFGGAAIILWFMIKPSGFTVGKDWARTLITLLFVGLLVNVVIRLWLMAQGLGVEEPGLNTTGIPEAAPGFFIPVINATASPMVLRSLSPLAVAISLMFITAPGFFSSQKRTIQWMLLAILVMGLVGAILSAGRGAMLITGFYAFIIALLRRRMMSIMLVGFVGVIFLIGVNVFSGAINSSAPYFVQRSLQYFMLEKGSSLTTIESSSSWRDELAQRAFAEWRSDPRIFLFGRATYNFGDADLTAMEMDGHYEAMMEISLRRGKAHRLTADCLLQYGLVGLILYYYLTLSILRFLIKLFRQQRKEDTVYRNLTFILMISFLIGLPMSVMASGWLSANNIWLLLVLILGYSKEQASRGEAKTEAQAVPRGMPLHVG